MGTTAGMMVMAGGIANASASYQGGNANQDIDRSNADLQRIQADQAIAQGNQDENREDIKASKLQGTQRAAFSGQGVVANAGTALVSPFGSATLARIPMMVTTIISSTSVNPRRRFRTIVAL